MGNDKARETRNSGKRKRVPPTAADARGYAPRPTDIVTFHRNDHLAAALAALVALLIYLRTLPPTITGDDSGEFITAAYTLGIAHPPGYPLFCLLGKLFTLIAPFNSIAWRVAFMSAFFGAATCYLVCLFVTKLTGHRIAGAAAAIALAVSSEFWKYNVVAETYSINAFLIVLGMLLLLTWYETREKKSLYFFALAYGLGLCNHHTMHFMGPVFALFILSVDRRPWLRWKTYLLVLGIAFAVWLVIHLYLPIRAVANPYSNWGNPYNWDNFWDVLTRKQYARGFIKNPRTFERFMQECAVFGRLYLEQFTPWMAWLPVAGVYALWKRNRYALGLVLGTFVYIVAGICLITNFGFDRESLWLNSKFWIPAYVMAAVLMGVAVAWICALKIGRVHLKLAVVPLGAAAFVLPLLAHFHNNDKSRYYFAYDYGMNILKTLEQDAVYFPSTDHTTYPLFYLQAVEGRRLDVTIGMKYGGINEELYKDMPPALRGGNTGKIVSRPEMDAVEKWIYANTDRPVYSSRMRSVEGVPGAKMVTAGLLYKLISPRFPLQDRDYWNEYTWHTTDDAEVRGDMTAENVLADYHFARGRDFLARADKKEGLDEMAAAARIGGKRKDLLNNIASICADYQLLDAAKTYYLKAIDADPDFRTALVNVAALFRFEGDYDNERKCRERIVKIDEHMFGANHPNVAASINDLGGAFLALGDLNRAKECFESALHVDETEFGADHPNTARDRSNLGIVLMRQGDREGAEKCRKRALNVFMKLAGKDHPFTQLVIQGAFMPSSGG